jgi:hypothetical protein
VQIFLIAIFRGDQLDWVVNICHGELVGDKEKVAEVHRRMQNLFYLYKELSFILSLTDGLKPV